LFLKVESARKVFFGMHNILVGTKDEGVQKRVGLQFRTIILYYLIFLALRLAWYNGLIVLQAYSNMTEKTTVQAILPTVDDRGIRVGKITIWSV